MLLLPVARAHPPEPRAPGSVRLPCCLTGGDPFHACGNVGLSPGQPGGVRLLVLPPAGGGPFHACGNVDLTTKSLGRSLLWNLDQDKAVKSFIGCHVLTGFVGLYQLGLQLNAVWYWSLETAAENPRLYDLCKPTKHNNNKKVLKVSGVRKDNAS